MAGVVIGTDVDGVAGRFDDCGEDDDRTRRARLGPVASHRRHPACQCSGSARVYVCGITPYETTHVGHAATFVWADVAARVLRLVGATVEVCRNVTDVDDHLLIQAKRDGVPWRSLAMQETYRFERDMAQLGVSDRPMSPAAGTMSTR